jgi:PKD repeat protein
MRPAYLVTLAVLAMFLKGCYDEPVANFDYSYASNIAPALVTFSNSSTEAEEFRWDFGDGNTSTTKNPTHTYTQAGNYTITLIAKGRGGEDDMPKNITIIQPTSYIIRNSSNYILYNVISAYWTGSEYIEVNEHGTLYQGNDSNEVITTRPEIDVVFETIDGTLFLVEYPFTLSVNLRNYLVITDNTSVIQVTSESASVNSIKDIRSIRQSGKALLMKDLVE